MLALIIQGRCMSELCQQQLTSLWHLIPLSWDVDKGNVVSYWKRAVMLSSRISNSHMTVSLTHLDQWVWLVEGRDYCMWFDLCITDLCNYLAIEPCNWRNSRLQHTIIALQYSRPKNGRRWLIGPTFFALHFLPLPTGAIQHNHCYSGWCREFSIQCHRASTLSARWRN